MAVAPSPEGGSDRHNSHLVMAPSAPLMCSGEDRAAVPQGRWVTVTHSHSFHRCSYSSTQAQPSSMPHMGDLRDTAAEPAF